MAMKFVSFHDERIADLAPDNENHYAILFDIIQRTKVADTQFELG
jgi:hypothetical protein